MSKFREELEALVYRNYTNPKSFWKKVAKELRYHAKNFEKFSDSDGYIYSVQVGNLSEEGLHEIETICVENGIEIMTAWSTPYYQCYYFKVKVL